MRTHRLHRNNYKKTPINTDFEVKRLRGYEKGIALLVALGTMIVILIIGALVLYLIVRGLGVTGGQTRYETVYEASVAALEIGKSDAKILNANASLPSIIKNVNIGNYNATIRVEPAGELSIGAAGTSEKFARATLGTGAGGAVSYCRDFYIQAEVVGQGGEQATIEAIQRLSFEP